MAGLAALVTTSVAVAHGIEGAKTAKAVAATFSASAGTTTTRTCTTTDGKTITVTDGKYTGVAAGDTDLAGPITLRDAQRHQHDRQGRDRARRVPHRRERP